MAITVGGPFKEGSARLGTALHEAQLRSVDLGRHGGAVAHVPLPGHGEKGPKSLQDGAPKIAKLPYFSGFMVDITIVFVGVISWFINPQTSLGGPILWE